MNTVLFLCSGNYYRSRFAEVLFNSEARRLGMPWQAESRGFRLYPGNHGPVSVHAVTGLQSLGLELPEPDRMPQTVTPADFESARLIIAVKEAEHREMARERFPDWVDRIEYWHIHDIDAAEPALALAELRQHVLALIERLAAEPD
jgi:protein-tyrosine phosphatase